MTAQPSPPPATPAPDPFELLFIGTHGFVIAVNRFTGREAWRTSLPDTGWSIVSMLVQEGVLYAASKGHVFALDPATGSIFWHNKLPGLGSDHVGLATMHTQIDSGAQPLAQAQADEARRRHAGH